MHTPIRVPRESQLSNSIGLDGTTICSLDASTLMLNEQEGGITLSLLSTTAICMDRNQHGQAAPHPKVRPRQSAPTLYDDSSASLVPHPYSSPLPQQTWSEIPLPYRPRDWVQPLERTQPHPPNGQGYDWRLRPSIPGNSLSSAPRPGAPRTRRRPRDLGEPTRQDDSEQRVDVSLLYPQLSPYDDRSSIHSAPDTLQHVRSASQPSSPNYMQLQHSARSDEPHPLQIPRSPTYPPAGRRRMHSASGVQDAAFADEHEFRLFVEATAGLGPESAFRHPHSQSSSGSSQRQQSIEHNSRRNERNGNGNARSPPARSASDHIVSPVEETPTTMWALQQLAQMPQASSQSAAPRRQRLETSASGLDLWLQPPSAATSPPVPGFTLPPAPSSTPPPARNFTSPVPPDFGMYDEEPEPDDDELPDYASSQAQAQAAQRVEATRRAQELQRRWQQAGGRRGL